MMYIRILEIKSIKESLFLFGPRKTGKTHFLKTNFPNSIFYDLLNSEIYLDLLKFPYHFREQILALAPKQLENPIIIDEVQLIPLLLNEVHWLIENTNAYFILCGSSARKLKREHANMLGGRALRYDFFPLSYREIPDFDLIKALNRGLIPSHYQADNYQRVLSAYITNYLKEEIIEEGLSRNLPAFSRFLESVAFTYSELVNFSNIARDCGEKATTVKEYYQILIDTMLGHYVYPYRKRIGRDIITATPKFYFFDMGLANKLKKSSFIELRGSEAGKSFEQFIFMELLIFRSYQEREFEINYWRTKSDLEVDFILKNGKIAIEVKISNNINKSMLRGLLAFCEEHKPEKAIIISNERNKRKLSYNGLDIILYPWNTFLDDLWKGKIL